MALALVLGERKARPERLTIGARCRFDEVAGAPAITRSAVKVSGRVSGLDEAGFAEAVETAGRLCPVSNALRGSVEIWVDARFEIA